MPQVIFFKFQVEILVIKLVLFIMLFLTGTICQSISKIFLIKPAFKSAVKNYLKITAI